MTGIDPNPALVVHEPRCKVCRSEHRHEIDAMLRSGGTQLEVRRYFNEVVGKEYFTPNNLSVHARKHLHSAAPEEWIRRAARADRVLGDPGAVPIPAAPEDALRTVVEVGLKLIDSGVCMPGPSDVIRAASELKRIEAQGIRGGRPEGPLELQDQKAGATPPSGAPATWGQLTQMMQRLRWETVRYERRA